MNANFFKYLFGSDVEPVFQSEIQFYSTLKYI